ncbi:MAG: pilin [Minisyncoccota bacterium]
MKKFQISLLSLLLTSYSLLPVPVFAALNKTGDLITAVGGLVSRLTVIAAGVALLVFLWGLAKFIFKSGDEKSHEEGAAIMKWGIVALFVMVSVWGIVNFMQRALGLPITPISNTNTAGEPAGNPGDPCADSFGNPTYTGDCGTY